MNAAPHRFRRTLGVGALTLLACALIAASLLGATVLGPAAVSAVNVRDVLANHLLGADIPVRNIKDAIVWEERLPRAILAALCGAGLGLCGVIMQSLLRNPLADPYILGVSSGASTGAVVVGIFGLGASRLSLSSGAFVGSLIAFGLVLLLARFCGGTTEKVLLAGIAATQLFSALTSLLVFAFADSDEARGVMFWLLGSLEGIRWFDVRIAAVVVFLGTLLCLYFARVLDAFAFGDTIASTLGINVTKIRLVLLGLCALITATLVSITGAIGFLGLVLPHVARLLLGTAQHMKVIPVTIVVGAVFMVWVDVFSRLAFAPTPLPAGVGTALVGVPVFVFLMARRRA
ncbi:FecCD family ABC transporter permease [Corynebacterium pelargi]|uniref:Hemin transport system permease protein HmuU n=1 Tax=Corynebacterium pelargi TaxID=1471400 RepID=A0A410WBF8_9CORY|nr:Hemin transport system permease protein HmuU [Corynebacterium pelargi]GGG73583.1 ABC transporter permease [Corynebacterium pelargi]